MSDHEINADLEGATHNVFAAYRGWPSRRNVGGDISVDDGRISLDLDLSVDYAGCYDAHDVLNELEMQFAVLMRGIRTELVRISRQHAVSGRPE